MNTPIPFAANLEAQYLPKNKFKSALLELLNY
jgi:2-oxoisovalerate dehydrogenase E1 component